MTPLLPPSLSAFPRYQVIEMAKNQVSPNGAMFLLPLSFSTAAAAAAAAACDDAKLQLPAAN